MPERFELALKIACVALAALLLYEFSRLVSRWNPLARAHVPTLPTLSTNRDAGGKTTNSPVAQMPKPAQAGVIKEGGEVGGIKLVRIGTNRVLIEQDGQQKELTVFSGYGGESLLPKPTAPLK